MDSIIKLYLQRAKNELELSKVIFKVTNDEKLQREVFNIDNTLTFYSAVISHSYYCIFYSAKALLLTKSIKTDSPEVHRKTLEEFKKNFVDNGVLDVELLKIYNKMIVRADELIGLFKLEKGKRGKFTYQKLPQANLEPARESVDNALKFFSNIYKIIERKIDR